MSEIDQLPSFTQTIQGEPAADRFDEILHLLKFGLNSSTACTGKKKACKGDRNLQAKQSVNEDEIICLCGGNIFLKGCCSKHNIFKASISQSEPCLSSSLQAAGPDEDLFVAMFRDYFGIPSTVEIA
jgi:hypothetical protein